MRLGPAPGRGGRREAGAGLLRQRRGDGLRRRGVRPAGDGDLGPAAFRLPYRRAFGERVRDGGAGARRRGDRMAEDRPRPAARGEQAAAGVELPLRRFDVLLRLVLLEAHGDQFVGQRAGRRAEGRLADEGVSLVERRIGAPLGVGHPQHPAQKLLDISSAADPRDRAEDIGEGAIPPLLQRLHGDDVLDGTGRVEQVDAVELALRAGGDGDPALRHALDLDQMSLQRRSRDLAVLRLRLKQRHRADIAAVPVSPFPPVSRGRRRRRSPRPPSCRARRGRWAV